MLTVHHLNNSRSHRILWLLEELEVPYEVAFYERDAKTNLAPRELRAIHPLGKSPVVTDGKVTIAESGAIVDYIVRRYDKDGKIAPTPDMTPLYEDYVYWLHYAEGSAMVPLILNNTLARLDTVSEEVNERVKGEITTHLSFIDESLTCRPFLLGDRFTAADIQMSFVGEVAKTRKLCETCFNIQAWVFRFQARPAYKRAIDRGGPYQFA
jgi:glutathione S-transferase